MSYGFDSKATATDTVKLPPNRTKTAAPAPDMAGVLQSGQELGFVSREASTRRKPGPKRTEPQDKITVTGRKQVIDRLKAYCDQNGVSYCDAIETLLNSAAKR